MIRVISYLVCLTALVWLGLSSLHFRKSIRTSLNDAYSLMRGVDPDHAGDNGKVLNSYYEDVYRNLPAIVPPACMLLVGSTALLLTGRCPRAEPLSSPRGE
jgi:hypothetical protein